MTWFDCSKEKPAQGKKVLCMGRKDYCVAYRIAEYYLPIYVTDPDLVRSLCHPEYWQHIDLMPGHHGEMWINPHKGSFEGMQMSIDEYEVVDPEGYRQLVESLTGWIK